MKRLKFVLAIVAYVCVLRIVAVLFENWPPKTGEDWLTTVVVLALGGLAMWRLNRYLPWGKEYKS